MLVVYFSLIINILVAGFWGIVLSFIYKNAAADYAFGKDSPARRILGNMYAAIALASIVALLSPPLLREIVLVLFPLQMLYKLLSFLTARNKRNPVIISNVCIAVLHSISLYLLVF